MASPFRTIFAEIETLDVLGKVSTSGLLGVFLGKCANNHALSVYSLNNVKIVMCLCSSGIVRK